MKKLLAIVLVSALAAACMTSCASMQSSSSQQASSKGKEIQIVTETQKNNGPATIINDNSVAVELKENPSTGYTIAYDNSNPTAVKETYNDYSQDEMPSNVTGAPVMHRWEFSAEKPGKVVLQFGLNPPGTDIFCEYSELQCTISFTVDDNLNIKDLTVDDRRS